MSSKDLQFFQNWSKHFILTTTRVPSRQQNVRETKYPKNRIISTFPRLRTKFPYKNHKVTHYGLSYHMNGSHHKYSCGTIDRHTTQHTIKSLSMPSFDTIDQHRLSHHNIPSDKNRSGIFCIMEKFVVGAKRPVFIFIKNVFQYKWRIFYGIFMEHLIVGTGALEKNSKRLLL